ncbi:MAG: hypothetical protein K5770_14490 [Lachnospiraceae bacterium]|nr:hypothetical protein [Lachnospiraceae bacterium]
MEKKGLNEADLDQVSGGKTYGNTPFGTQVGTTAFGNAVDQNGNVLFKDKVGDTVVLTSAQWNKLLSNYNRPGENPERYLMSVPISELVQAGLISVNPFGLQ